VEVVDGQVSVRVKPRHFQTGSEQLLILICAPLRPADPGVSDPRELGLPIFAVNLEPIASRPLLCPLSGS
jgi:hypothetical protein